MNDEIRAARNQRRAYRKQADMLMVECEFLLTKHMNAILKEQPGQMAPQQRDLLVALVGVIGQLKDQRLAATWTSKLADAIRANPRLLDTVPGMKSLHKVAGMAGKVLKASSPDRRTQSERRREEGEAKRAGIDIEEYRRLKGTSPKRADSFLDDLPDGGSA